MLYVLDIMQVTFVTEPIVDLPTTSFSSQGSGTQTKTSNVPKQMPAKFQLQVPKQQMGGAPYIAWFERQVKLSYNGFRGKAIHT